MIGRHTQALHLQFRCYLLYSFARGSIDDARAVMRFSQALDAPDLLPLLFRMHDINGQIRPVEAADKCLRFCEAQLLDYVGTNVRRSRRREGENLRAPSGSIERLDYSFQPQIVGTKVVAPR